MTGHDLQRVRTEEFRATQREMASLLGVDPRRYQRQEARGEGEIDELWSLAVTLLRLLKRLPPPEA